MKYLSFSFKLKDLDLSSLEDTRAYQVSLLAMDLIKLDEEEFKLIKAELEESTLCQFSDDEKAVEALDLIFDISIDVSNAVPELIFEPGDMLYAIEIEGLEESDDYSEAIFKLYSISLINKF